MTRKTPIDYDADGDNGDGLIDVKNLAQLNAIRYDLNGDGEVDRSADANAYALAFPDIGTNMGCRNNWCRGYELLNDLDFDTNGDSLITVADSTYFFHIGTKDSTGFVPIGRSGSGFKATFKGNGHTISNIFIKRGTPHVSVGLFDYLHDIGRIEGVGLINAQVTGYNTDNNVGPVGALVGSTEGGIVVNSYVTGTVSGSLQVGGLVGHNPSNGRVIASYSTASVTGSSDENASVGALVGLNHSTIQVSYAIGIDKVSGRSQGLVGRSSGSGRITASYYDSETTGVGGGTGAKTTAQLQAPTSYNSTLGNDQTAIYKTWDDQNVDGTSGNDDAWAFGESNQYPVLRYAGHDTTAQFAAQPDKTPNFGPATVRDTTFMANNPVSMTLPEALATSGNGKLIYALINSPLPSGLTFNNLTRVISGTPTTAVPLPASTYMMSVSDSDNNTAVSDTDTLTFNIAVTILVTIPDDSLRAVILDSLHSLGMASNDTVTADDMKQLTRLDAPNKGITNLTGLEFATSLDTLDLGQVDSLGIEVNSNDITDISALSGLTSLTSLDLGGNRITAIDSLARLTSLTTLNLRGNRIADISSLSGLTSPTHLYLENNRITAIDPLRVTGLTSLISLSLHDNRISDLSPLVYNTGLGWGIDRPTVRLGGNPLSIKSRTTYIDSLGIDGRRVTVWFDLISDAELVEVSGDGQIGIPGQALEDSFVVRVRSKDIEPYPYRNLPVTFSVTAGGGTLNGTHSTINDTTDSNGQARALLTLGATAGTDTVKAFVEGPSDTLSLIFTATVLSPTSVVTIPDDSLRAVITASLGMASNDTIITADDMSRLTRLDAPDKGIKNLTGLEFATELDTLDLRNNRITAIDSLARLTSLTYLDLGGNRITAIDSLARLTSLTTLNFRGNSIADISSLSGLTSLTWLNLGANNIENISSLSRLIRLTWLNLYNNRITDISSLSGLTSLSFLNLYNNRIADISPLVNNTGLGGTVNLGGNPLSATSRVHILRTLTLPLERGGRGVRVVFDQLSNAELAIVSGNRQIGIPGRALEDSFIVRVQRKIDEFPYINLPVTFSVTAGGGSLNWTHSTINDTTDSNGQARALLTLGATVGMDTVKAFVAIDTLVAGASDTLVVGVSDTLIFTTVSNGPVPIPDDSLRAVILDSLDMASNDTITVSDMQELTRLDAPNKDIRDLTGLEFATSLEVLNLGYEFVNGNYVNSNTISDISPIAGLTNLTGLQLSGNSISDIDPLASLTNLTYLELSLELSGNSIADISPLRGLTNLTQLYLSGISDISALRDLTNLTYLNLNENNLTDTDISDLSGLTNLTGLNLGGNDISDISALQSLTSLTRLRLYGNDISDISALQSLTSLTLLNLWNNNISNISVLSHLPRLTELYLGGNDISDISVLSNLPRLTELYLGRSKISDISSLSGLTNLTTLNLWSNSISDISGLSGLTNLTTLNLNGNRIKDISSLSDLTSLITLNLAWNSIIDISDLSGLTGLTRLNLEGNLISAIDSLANLTNLIELDLGVNRISNLLPLENNTGLRSGDQVDVRGNPLSALSRTSSIPTLTGTDRSVTVSFDTLSVARLVKVSGDRQIGKAGDALEDSFVVKVQSRNDATYPYRNLPVTFSVTAGSGSLSATSATTDYNGLARTRLTLGVTAGTDTVKAFVEGASDTLRLIFTVSNGPVTIHDDSLRAVILRHRDLAINDTITAGDMRSLTRLDAPNKGIRDLTGLEFATNLEVLNLGYEFVNGNYVNSNTISDISPIAGLTNLTGLQLSGNSISDIDPLASLTNLTYLDLSLELSGNSIADISPLRGLTSLTQLYLSFSGISDISALRDLTSLTYLNLNENNLTNTDISDLSGLTNLTGLNLGGNDISDISALQSLTSLTRLRLYGNDISDISALQSLTSLTLLNLWNNNISNISVLSHLPRLTELYLGGNDISDISVLSHLPLLTELYLGSNNISDISSLSDLTNLTTLYLWSNSISDISSLSDLTNLTTLNLNGNLIKDISDLSGLTNLITLNLAWNSIRDILPLSGLDSLKTLRLDHNRISDLSPLMANTELVGIGDQVDVRGNPLSAASRTSYIPTLTGTNRSVTVSFDTLSVARLVNVSGDGQIGKAGEALPHPFVVKVQSKNDEAYAYNNLPVTFSITAGGGSLSATSAMTDYNGLARTRLTRGATSSGYTVKAFVEGASDTLIFTTLSPKPVTIPDNSLRAAILDSLHSLDRASNDTITVSDMLHLTRLDAPNKDIRTLTGLEFALNLDTLDLRNNRITAIDSLARLTHLKKLSLGGNGISDIASLARLTNLTWLWLSYNRISDIDSLANLTNLTWLGLGDNRITTIDSLSGLTNLTRLGLSNNRITDLSPLVDNANNEGLGSGDKVNVRGNPLSALSRTSYIPTLTNDKNVMVSFDNLTLPGLSLVKVLGDEQIGTVGTVLAKPFVVKVQDQNSRGYAGLPVAFSVTAGGGSLSTNTDTTDATGHAETTLKLGTTASTHTVLVSVEGISQTLTFTATLPTPDFDGNGQVNFADFMALANKIGPGQGRGSYEVKYDLDGDGIVGMGDFEVFMSRFSDSKFDAAK